jgi:xanthine dehydrogenase molybdopterin-binding subunit B
LFFFSKQLQAITYTQIILPQPIVVGNVNEAFSQSANVISGTFSLSSLVNATNFIILGSVANGGQIHFHMETQTVVVVPQEDNQLLIYAAKYFLLSQLFHPFLCLPSFRQW